MLSAAASDHGFAEEPSRSPPADSGGITDIRDSLHALLLESGQKPTDSSDNALAEMIGAPAFGSLSPSEQHLALLLAARSALLLKHYDLARLRATRATAMPDAGIEDWKVRLFAAGALEDTAEEMGCIIEIGRRWNGALASLPPALIFRAASDAARSGEPEREIAMLQTLFDARWRPPDGADPSSLWRDLTLLLLEKDEKIEAEDTASQVTDPYVIVAMQSDNRFASVMRSGVVEGNVEKLLRSQLAELYNQVRELPRSLATLARLLRLLLQAGKADEVVELTDQVEQRLLATGPPDSPYEDTAKQLPWIYERRGNALLALGRYAEAVADKQTAADTGKASDPVSHALNLSMLLCRLDRPDEALAALPPLDRASPHGRAVAELVQLISAIELANEAEAERLLTAMQSDPLIGPRDLEEALIVSGRRADAAALYRSRLENSRLRGDALVELQDYKQTPAPPQVLAWRKELDAVKALPEVRAALRHVGSSHRYPLPGELF